MDLSQQLAVTQPWWVYQTQDIEYALRVKLEHWLEVIRNAVEANKKAGRNPARSKSLPGSTWGVS